MRRGVKNSDMGRRIVTCDLLPTIVKITFLNCDAVTQTIRVCCQSISEMLNESRKRTRTFSGLFVRISTLT